MILETWCVEFTDEHGQQIRRIFDTEREAQRYAKDASQRGHKVAVWDLMHRSYT